MKQSPARPPSDGQVELPRSDLVSGESSSEKCWHGGMLARRLARRVRRVRPVRRAACEHNLLDAHMTPLSENTRSALTSQLSDEQIKVFDLPLVGAGLNVCSAVPGSGKSTTLGLVVAKAIAEHLDVLVLTSTVSARMTALTKINVALASVDLPEISARKVRTLHSVAFGNNKREDSRFRIGEIRPFLLDSFDAYMDERRLKASGVSSWIEFWETRSSELSRAERNKLIDASVDGDVSTLGLLLYKHCLVDTHETALLDGGSFGTERSPLENTTKVRGTLVNNRLEAAYTTPAMSHVISNAHSQMRISHVSDQSDSIALYAESGKAPIGRGGVLVIDECQDSTAQQVEIIKASLWSGARVVVFGDPCQGIFRFAGASPDPMRDLCLEADKCATPVRKLGLTQNFRSTKQITDASALALSDHDRCSRAPPWSAVDGPPVIKILALDDQQECAMVRDEIKRQVNECNCGFGDIAVIRLKNFVHGDLCAHTLSRSGVPYCIAGAPERDATHPTYRTLAILNVLLSESKSATVDELQVAVRAVNGCTFSDDVKAIVSEAMQELRGSTALSVFLDEEEMVSRMEERVLSTQRARKRKFTQQTLFGGAVEKTTDSHKVANMLKSISVFREAKALVDTWVDATLDGVPYTINGLGGRVRPPIPGLDTQSAMGELLLNVFTQIVEIPANDEKRRDMELAPFLKLADEYDTPEDIREIEEFVELQTERLLCSNERDRVVLSTIHKFKGRERNVVIVMGFGSNLDRRSLREIDLLPFAGLLQKDENLYYRKIRETAREVVIEKQRLMHVALSRPRQQLIVTAVDRFASCI